MPQGNPFTCRIYSYPGRIKKLYHFITLVTTVESGFVGGSKPLELICKESTDSRRTFTGSVIRMIEKGKSKKSGKQKA